MPFHNPYHFVPVQRSASLEEMTVDAFDAGTVDHVTHDRYVSGTRDDAEPVYSGRLLCQLVTEGPVVIGDQRDELADGSHRVSPFKLDGVPAIPASTLRGLVSSIAEAASNSALRVLEDRPLAAQVDMSSQDCFRKISGECLPFNPNRETLSIAEQLFGFVEQPSSENSDDASRTLASRLRFSFGLLAADQEKPLGDEKLLKILDSPKPPSPALYFKWRQNRNQRILKKKLDPVSHDPKGRKFYLLRRNIDEINEKEWETHLQDQHLKQKSRVTPLRAGLQFYFHIDFENVSRTELSLLCYAIRPMLSFRHKLGMGKPLGLGQVRIDPLGLFYMDRIKRYKETSLFDADRYQGCWVHDQAQPDQWPECYHAERLAHQKDGTDRFPSFDTLNSLFRKTMEKEYPDILRALDILGDPAYVKEPVHYPQIKGAKDATMETETYRWFVVNDREPKRGEKDTSQQLKPLMADSPELPSLSEHTWSR